ncbi:thiol reductant ABC exporter subunit CydC [Actinotalea sp. JY-7876]|uniref:thiol reductant ABC exporter subunit CydC n=2 Tax=unclassified Actinotalea TaxID=2638618 RepID=UPI0015F61340|nr:thiol reductant ABC exporter subunit CydC [Actinotalea sp. JY-7876]
MSAPRPARQRDPLLRTLAMLDVDRGRVVRAVLAGAGSLGSAVALAAVSAWLIARASQMPPVMYLTIAAVTVRALGISRGLLRYVERLVSHDVALRGMARLRARLYERLADSPVDRVVGLRRGDLLARVGADVDAVGDAVVRGLLPAAVALVVGVGSVVLVGAFLPGAGAVLAACLVLAGVVAPWWAVRAARDAELGAADARARVAEETMTLLQGADELRVAGRVPTLLERLRRSDADLAAATDRAAARAAGGAALGPLATGLAVLGAVVLGTAATTSGVLAPVELAVVVLTPLAAFEATGLLPAAAVQLLRSRRAAARLVALLDDADPSPEEAPPAAAAVPDGGPLLEARGLACGWPGRPVACAGVDLVLHAGDRVAVVGPSGAGKTTLLLTLAGLLPPRAGSVRTGGRDLAALPRAEAAGVVVVTTEDAHVFDTTVLENLRVARGDVTPAQAGDALAAVGLGAWLAALPDGLDTMLGSGGARVSGGERRRLLVARALLSRAPVLLLDEPAEHLDDGAAALLTGLLDGSLAPGRAVVVVTHRSEGLEAADAVLELAGRSAPAAGRG